MEQTKSENLEATIAAGDAVEQVVRSEGWKYIERKLCRDVQSLFEKMVSGKYEEGETYDFVRAKVRVIDDLLHAPQRILVDREWAQEQLAQMSDVQTEALDE